MDNFFEEMDSTYIRPMLMKYDRCIDEGLDYTEATTIILLLLCQVRISLVMNTTGNFSRNLSSFHSLEMDMTAFLLQTPGVEKWRREIENEELKVL